MSTIDIYAVLEKFKNDPDRIGSAVQLIECITEYLREAEQHGYLGTLYRTDFEVEGAGAFPIDMLRYTSSWPKGESDAQAIEDSFSFDTIQDLPIASSARRTISLSKYHRDPEPQLAADRWQAKFRWRVARVIETVAI